MVKLRGFFALRVQTCTVQIHTSAQCVSCDYPRWLPAQFKCLNMTQLGIDFLAKQT